MRNPLLGGVDQLHHRWAWGELEWQRFSLNWTKQVGQSRWGFELFWQALLLPRTTGANAQTALMILAEHSCRPAYESSRERCRDAERLEVTV
ncbi:hypothetical protein RISK_002183 [Rhodopirellula islandica]|uniref:Uncharacterized protein n=1 Tax=Rhodopirellula islandica TaxID=595434 RepID=A0A0J1BG96_RHOIS|nr:hypothetical protein [Rhodopirellula islandica]KLU05551.1 hypothetical protein RISK_002183 [Rhodopirellula islandica]